jgi:hypothetical protein
MTPLIKFVFDLPHSAQVIENAYSRLQIAGFLFFEVCLELAALD